jgi:uncharacterized protein YgbK (DUF1537 family)
MLLGAIADDFTGASDLANTLAKEGMATTLFVGVPKGEVSGTEAGVVALKTRSIAPADAVNQSLAALDWLKGQRVEQILFKYCSTFDSTPEGNIGPVAEALSEALDAGIAIVALYSRRPGAPSIKAISSSANGFSTNPAWRSIRLPP